MSKYTINLNEFDFNKPQKILRDMFNKENIKFIDLLPELRKMSVNDIYWKLNPHFNKKGNKVIAEILYDYFGICDPEKR